jgi:hypothetical protein
LGGTIYLPADLEVGQQGTLPPGSIIGNMVIAATT